MKRRQEEEALMGHVDRHRAAHQAFNAKALNELRTMCTDDMVFEDKPRGIAMKSGDEFIDWIQGWKTLMSDAAVTDPTYYDAGSTTIARFVGRGMNDGAMGPIPATGKRMSMDFCEIMHWSEDGKIVGGEILYDQMTMLVQLGLAEPPPAP
jgi:ketosteroid isomerase-like protein